MGHSYKGASVPSANHSAPPVTPTLTLSGDDLILTNIGAQPTWYLYESSNGGITYDVIDSGTPPPPINFTGDAASTRWYFADPDNHQFTPGPNSSNVVIVP